MEYLLNIIVNNFTPFLANIALLIILSWVIVYSYEKNQTNILNITVSNQIKIGVVFAIVSVLMMHTPLVFEKGIIMDPRAVPILFSGIIGGPIAGIIATSASFFVRLSLGGAGMLGGLVYILVFGVAGIVWYMLNKHKELINPKKSVYLIVGITALTVPVVLLLPEGKRLGALISLWPLMFIANGLGAYILGKIASIEIQKSKNKLELQEIVKMQEDQIDKQDLKLIDYLMQKYGDKVFTSEFSGDIYTLMNQTQNSMVLTGSLKDDLPIIFVNKAFENMFGYTKDEVIGKNPRFLQNDDREQRGLEIIRDKLSKNEHVSTILRNYNKNGKLIFIELSISPIIDEQTKEIKFFLAIEKDVTKEQMLLKQIKGMI